MASGMLSFGQSDISNKLSISTKMFIDERDGALEMKRHAVSEKQLGLEFVGKRIRPSKNDDRIYAAPDTIDGRVYISAFIRMENNANVRDLVNKGVQIQSSFDNGLYTALIPVERIEEVAGLTNVKRINVSMLMHPFTNKARQATNVDDALTKSADAVALGLSKQYDGTGVVLGVIDTGIDFQHIAFKDASGNSRIKRAYVYNGSSAKEYTSITSSSPTTDDKSEDHGTHTSSTAGGSSVIVSGSNVTVTNDHANATYGGMAPGADLYLAGINGLSSTYMANAFQKICDYADAQGKPVVISNSWGSQYGPHDGTGDFADITAQYFGSSHPNHVCLFAASNDGGKSKDGEGGGYHVSGTASSSSPLGSILRAASYSNTDAGYYYYGIIANAWSRSKLSSGSLACKIFVLDSSTGAVKTSVTVTPSTSGATVSGLSSYFSGTLYAYKDYVSSNKSQIMLYTSGLTSRSYTTTTKNGSTYYKSKYTLAVQFYPTSGSCTIDAWGGSYGYFTNHLSTSGYTWTNGSDDMCVSDEATDPNVISIGAYVTANTWKAASGSSYSMSDVYTVGDIAYFSSYATANQSPTGIQYPWITAPGARLAAGVNHYHTASVDDYSYYGSDFSSDLVVNSSSYPYAMMEGTSMATPVAAGIVALWLQAAKESGQSLTSSDIKNIMKQTAIKDSYTTTGANASHFGNGKINALAGLQQILGSTPGTVVTTPVITASASSMSFSANAGETQTKSITVSGSNLSGAITVAVSGSAFSANTTSISTTQAASGKVVNVTFTAPSTAGSYTGTLTLTSASAATVTVALSGTSVAQQVDPDPQPTTTKEVYKLVSSVTSGKQYVIVNKNAAGSANAVTTNSSHTVTSSSVNIVSGNDGSGNTIKYIEEPSSYAVWTCSTSSSSKRFKNGSYYLYHSNNKLSMSTSTSKANWTVGSNAASLYYSSGGYKYLAYSSGWTIASSSSSVYFFEKTTITVPGEDPVVTPDPVLNVSSSALSFSTEEGTPVSQTFTVSGTDLTSSVSVRLTDYNGVYAVSPSTITAASAMAGATVTVTFSPEAAGSYSGSVALTSGSASASVALSGTATAAPVVEDPEEEPAGGTASDSYLNLHKYSTIDDAGYSGVKNFYTYSEKSDGSAWLTLAPYGAYYSSSYQGWLTYSSNSSTSTTWSAYDVFQGSSAYFETTTSWWGGTSSSARAVTSSSNGTATQTYYVSNLTAVKVYGYNPRSSSNTTVSVYECSVSSNGSISASSTAVTSASYSTSYKSFIITLDNLDASKVYKVVVSFKRTYFYEIAFQTTQSSWANSTNHGDMGTVGISTMNADEQSETRIFTINGQYVGNDIQSLDKGMYIIDGKKVMIK